MMIHNQNRNSLFAATFLLSVAFIAACDSDDDDAGGAKCGGGTPCGGDVVGTWEVKESCAVGSIVNQMNAMCSGATFDASGMKVTGTMKFNADKTYRDDTILNGTTKMTMPASCLQQEDGTTLTCKQFSEVFGAILAFGGATDEIKLDCTGTSTCACNMTFKDSKKDEAGTYAIAGSKITLTESDADEDDEPDTSDFCVQGSSLTMNEAAAGAGSTGGASIKLTKK